MDPETDEETLSHHVMQEMAAAEAGSPVMLQMTPATAFVVVSQMQIVISEPGKLSGTARSEVVQAITDHFHQYPALMELIRRCHDRK